MTIEEVIAELEKASEGSRELDCRIHQITTGGPPHSVTSAIPLYTRSLDAAMTLTNRIRFRNSRGYIQINGPRKYLHIPIESPNYWRATVWAGPELQAKESIGWGATAALALCIAALKARSRQP